MAAALNLVNKFIATESAAHLNAQIPLIVFSVFGEPFFAIIYSLFCWRAACKHNTQDAQSPIFILKISLGRLQREKEIRKNSNTRMLLLAYN